MADFTLPNTPSGPFWNMYPEIKMMLFDKEVGLSIKV
jgi:hypothetical protein